MYTLACSVAMTIANNKDGLPTIHNNRFSMPSEQKFSIYTR